MSTSFDPSSAVSRIQLDNLLPSGLVPITVSGVLAAGDKFKVEVWAGRTLLAAGAMYPHLEGPRAGRFNLGLVGIAGIDPGQRGQLVVRAWDGTTGNTFDEASVRGTSAPFDTLPLGGPNPAGGPDLLPPKLDGLRPFDLSARS